MPSRTEHILNKYTTMGSCRNLWEREKRLIAALLIYAVLFNFEWGRYVLYPFMIFATWCHETLGHGFAAILVGSRIKYIELYKNGGGWCQWGSIPARNETIERLKDAFVYSAGYSMTAWTGCFLLLFRRTRKGPKYGCIGLGVVILLSCLLWIRTGFGLLMMIPFGAVLIILGFLLEGRGLGTFYALLGATCCVTAILDAHDMFMDSAHFDGSEEDETTDAMQVADELGGTHFMWTLIWYIQAVVCLLIGLLLAFDPKDDEKEYDMYQGYDENNIPTAVAAPVSTIAMTNLELGYKQEMANMDNGSRAQQSYVAPSVRDQTQAASVY